jgi:hypothetical protein
MPTPKWHYTCQNECPENIVILTHPVVREYRDNSFPLSPVRTVAGLGAMWGEEKAREYLEKAAFKSIETNQLAHDIQNNWYVVRK